MLVGLLGHESGNERHHDDAIVFLDALQHVVRDVARMARDGAGRGVTEHYWSVGRVQRDSHGVGMDVGQVHQHTKAIHLSHHLAAKLREAVDLRLVSAGVGPVHVLEMGQRHVPRAQPMKHSQSAQGVVDGVSALNANERADLARIESRLDVVRRQR